MQRDGEASWTGRARRDGVRALGRGADGRGAGVRCGAGRMSPARVRLSSVFIVLDRRDTGASIRMVDETGRALQPEQAVDDIAARVAELEVEHDHPRWVWADTSTIYAELLARGVRVHRCVDLRLSHAILRNSALSAASALATAPANAWDDPTAGERAAGERVARDRAAGEMAAVGRAASTALFEVEVEIDVAEAPADPLPEFELQREAIRSSLDANRLGLLLAAESAGALVAAEMRHAGLPWRVDVHEQLLEGELGERPGPRERPRKLDLVLAVVRRELDAPSLNPDSPPELLTALVRAGIRTESTRSWELRDIDHPAIPPLLEYKRLARLWSANGWHWLESHVVDGRFHPDFVPGGVVTGRWASRGGGGALQLPKQVRGAVAADPGWKLVVADAAQLEPRILAALAGDRAMVAAGSAGDLYAGIVASGAVDTRQDAKLAMLGAMYGATSGDAGRLMPRLARAYPRAVALVEDAARAGERGEVVTTRLGRSSPRGRAGAYDETASSDDLARTRARAKAWGRFTRNFVVQGTAAEWALCWMASLRVRLRTLGDDRGLQVEPHLVFFLHDEVVVHSPTELAPAVEREIREAAADAGRLLFGRLPVEFPLTVTTVDDYSQAE